MGRQTEWTRGLLAGLLAMGVLGACAGPQQRQRTAPEPAKLAAAKPVAKQASKALPKAPVRSSAALCAPRAGDAAALASGKFARFWPVFRDRVGRGCIESVAALTAFPFLWVDPASDEAGRMIARAEFARSLQALLAADAGQRAAPETMRQWLLRSPTSAPLRLAASSERARAGNLEFQRIAGRWQLARGFLRSRPLPALDAEPATRVAVLRAQRLLNLRRGARLDEDGEPGARTLAALRGLGEAATAGEAGLVAVAFHQLDPSLAPAQLPAGEPTWLRLAQQHIGEFEDSTPERHNPWIQRLHPSSGLHAGLADEVPWCSSFLNSLLQQQGIAGTGDARALSWLAWGQALAAPRAGAIVVLHRWRGPDGRWLKPREGNHVGLYVSASAQAWRLLGGNQADAVSYADYAKAEFELVTVRWPRLPQALTVAKPTRKAAPQTLLAAVPATAAPEPPLVPTPVPKVLPTRPAREPLLMVLNSGDATVSLVDARLGRELSRFDVGKEPHHAMPTPDGRSLVVASSVGNELLLLDPRTGAIQRRVPDIVDPYHIGFSPDGRWFVSAAFALNHVDLYRYRDGRFEHRQRIPLADTPSHMAFSDDSRKVFISLEGSDEIAAIALDSGRLVWRLAVGQQPAGLWMAPDGRLWVANTGEDQVRVIDVAQRREVARIVTASGAHAILPLADGRTVLVSNRADDSISLVDVQSLAVTGRIAVPGGPDCMALSADGRTLYVTARWARQLVVIDLVSRQRLRSVAVGRSPHGVYVDT